MSKYCEQVGKIGLLLDFLHATNIVALKPRNSTRLSTPDNGIMTFHSFHTIVSINYST